jgi:hypothetical protein
MATETRRYGKGMPEKTKSKQSDRERAAVLRTGTANRNNEP